ncbi:isopentenyl-diphosphate delta-isomerase [Vibrio sp. 10N.286.49.C2]|uniref:isopentenyl-diphosphate Delta-isomerase n=1 Tax=unclassified Vibrio TaxID=2614977 RepID=UPI000C83BF7A|nr:MULTISPECIES: isopentenyl-diphosphate Delta-isomerase [unclassified Vibrio]PMH34872.1 isopentenyl-diphosphate delta-isomerase [Vibrio sp. 10N.286.49.C2]PMH51340.1 isopentenyl-diphosphate delta-isomerase [Vibrio sp. 10N.286.49.B1]PMH83713.1 isopentenyl-diphosphate delta-isomerase [Vibrio sp. 10N.286.48.B7]
MYDDIVVIVDRLGNQIGVEEKLNTHRLGLRHLAFSVMLYRKTANGFEYLLQKRALNKYHSAGLWTNTCCSHPRPEESIIAASTRRLVEEMGIDATLELEDIGHISYCAKFSNGLTENELDHVVIAHIDDVATKLNPDEASQCQWWSESQVDAHLANQRSDFTAWFPLVFEKIKRHLHQSNQ